MTSTLSVGKHFGDHLVDADLCGHLTGGTFVVTREQHRAQSETAQPGDRLSGCRLHGVGDHDDRASFAVPSA